MIPNRTDEFSDIIKNAERFLETEIDKFVEESIHQQKAKQRDYEMERELGQLQLNVLLKIIEEEAGAISRLPTSTAAEAQFLLGKEEGLRKALNLLQDLMQKTNNFYSPKDTP